MASKSLEKGAIHFKSGSIVPRWIFSIERRRNQHKMRFNVDTLVRRVDGHLVMFPDSRMGKEEHFMSYGHHEYVEYILMPYSKWDKTLFFCDTKKHAEQTIKAILDGTALNG